MTIEEWFTFTGSGYFSEAFSLTNDANDTNPPGATNGRSVLGTVSYPDNGSGNGSHIGESLAGYAGGEVDAEETTGFGVNGRGYLDNGQTWMMTAVVDGSANTMSYYLNGVLQQTVPTTANLLSQFSFTNVYLGRSAFATDNGSCGSIDEFRVYDNAQSGDSIATDYANGPNVVPEPLSLSIITLAGLRACDQRRHKGERLSRRNGV